MHGCSIKYQGRCISEIQTLVSAGLRENGCLDLALPLPGGSDSGIQQKANAISPSFDDEERKGPDSAKIAGNFTDNVKSSPSLGSDMNFKMQNENAPKRPGQDAAADEESNLSYGSE